MPFHPLDPHRIVLNKSDENHPPVTLSVESKIEGKPIPSQHILVIGGGVSGLMTAWILLDKGYPVTILAKDWAWTKDFQHSRLTSQIAGALWEFPPGSYGSTEIEKLKNQNDKTGFAGLDHYREWALESYDFYCALNDMQDGKLRTQFGVSITKLHQFFFRDFQKEAETDLDYGKMLAIKNNNLNNRIKGFERLEKDKLSAILNELNVGDEWRRKIKFGYTHDAPIINTDKAMVFLMTIVRNKGADFETRELKLDPKDPQSGSLAALSKKLKEEYNVAAIVNATGLGAKDLVPDNDVYPVRGAIKRISNENTDTFGALNEAYMVPPQQESKAVFIVPRNDETLIVGSIVQPHNDQLNLVENSPEVQVMWKRARSFLPALNDSMTIPWYPMAQGLRPFTTKKAKVRVEDKEVPVIPIIHNYGHGGSGWTLAVGCARSAVFLLEMLAVEKPTAAKVKEVNQMLYPH